MKTLDNTLDGKVAVVLGASAAGGTGWCIARALAAAGAKVVVAARRLPELTALADSIGATPVQCDAGDEGQVSRLADLAVAKHGRVDIAVNAAFAVAHGAIADATRDMLMPLIETNYFGNVYFVKHMAKAIGSGGSITLISSSSSQNTVQPFFPYACSKAALDCLVRYAALEYGPRKIRVNSILPGAIRSDAARELWAMPGMEALFARDVPLGRIGEPSDYAGAVLWLATAPYVTGLNLPVSGGFAPDALAVSLGMAHPLNENGPAEAGPIVDASSSPTCYFQAAPKVMPYSRGTPGSLQPPVPW